MSNLTVAVLDPLERVILDTIKAGMPSSWTLCVASNTSFQAQAAALGSADAAFVIAAPMTADLLKLAPKLGFIQKLGAGVDHIDLNACKSRGIGLARLYAGNAIPVAEHTVMLMLAAYRRLPLLDRQMREGIWAKEECRAVNRHIFGKTVGIVGMGAIGQAVAQILSSFGVTVIYSDPVRPPEEVERQLNIRRVSLDELLALSDVVSLHLPLTTETAKFLDESRIAAMKPGSVLVNCARGGLVDEVALAEALDSGHLFSVAADTFSTEPPVANPLLSRVNTILSPHCAGATIDNFASIVQRAIANTERFAAGEPLPPNDVWIAPGRRAAA